MKLWDIWRESLSTQALGISLEETFSTCIREGILLPIFDGFDELCSLRARQFRVEDTLQELLDLVGDGEGRILMTTRKGYWDAANEQQILKQCRVFELLPFNKFQSDRYFESRFPTQFEARARAKNVASRVAGDLYADVAPKYPPAVERPTAVPAILELISASVEDDDSPEGVSRYGHLMQGNPLRAVLLMLCNRECQRQGLLANAEEQLRVFTELAVGFALRMRREEVELCAQCTSAEFSDSVQVQKLFAPHPLLSREGEEFRFRFDFLRDFLRAQWMQENWDNPSLRKQLLGLLEEYSLGTSAVFEYLSQRLVSSIAWMVSIASAVNWAREQKSDRAIAGLWHLAFATCGRSAGSTTRADRVRQLLEIFGDVSSRTFSRVHFVGRIAGLDLSDVTFLECSFEDCTVAGCEFRSDEPLQRV